MGGLIATIVASAFEVEKLVLLAPAFAVMNRGAVWARLVAPFTPFIRRGRPNLETDATRRQLFDAYWADDPAAGVVELRRLAALARRRLPSLRAKLLVVAGERDVVVPASVAAYVAREAAFSASCETRTIEGAGHLFPFDEHSAEACGIVREWLTRTV
jgi:esterase/lipase